MPLPFGLSRYVDACNSLLPQTFRYIIIASLLGVRHVVLAVNKLDLVGFDQTAFETIASDFELFAAQLKFKNVQPIPISALQGDNIASRSERTPCMGAPVCSIT